MGRQASPRTGRSYICFKDILKEVEHNLSKLDTCTKHDFSPADDTTPRGRMGKHVCANCGGEVEASEARWYRRGLVHG